MKVPAALTLKLRVGNSYYPVTEALSEVRRGKQGNIFYIHQGDHDIRNCQSTPKGTSPLVDIVSRDVIL